MARIAVSFQVGIFRSRKRKIGSNAYQGRQKSLLDEDKNTLRIGYTR